MTKQTLTVEYESEKDLRNALKSLHFDEKGKPIKCVDSYNQGICATSFTLQYSEYELIKEAFDYYTNSLNDGKGISIVNHYAGTLLAKLGDQVEGGV